MAIAPQISLNKQRQFQLSTVRTKREDCAGLTDDELVKKLFFEKLDAEAGDR